MNNVLADDPPLSPEPYIYNTFTPPLNSFGVGEHTIKTVNWTYFKQLFNTHCDWSLEYKLTSSSSWTGGNQYMTIKKIWNDVLGGWKFNLILDVPVDIYAARFTFGCDLFVLDYVERDGWQVNLNYTIPNTDETYNVFFNWSDMANIPGIVFSKGMSDDMFWFRFSKSGGINAGVYEFDPWFGYQESADDSTGIENVIYGGNASLVFNGDNATAHSICGNFIVSANGYDVPITCAIYDNATTTLVAQTEERIFNSAFTYDWQTFNFTTDVYLDNNTDYLLMVWSNSSSDYDVKLAEDSADDKGYYVRDYSRDYDAASGVFPETFTRDNQGTNWRPLIYCNYTTNYNPVLDCVSPDNESTGNNLSGYCRIFVNDTDGNLMNITWRTNESGSWVTVADNNSVSCNSSYDLYFPDFNGGDSQYWWEILLDDGYTNISSRFWFETSVNASTNDAPTITNIIPVNQSGGINLSGYCRATFNDENGNLLNITWRTNESGSWVSIANNASVACNSSYDLYFPDFNGGGVSYWWQVFVDDGTDNVSFIYWFTTLVNVSISVTNEYPSNGTILFGLQPTLHFDLDSIYGEMSYKIYTGDTAESCNNLIASATGLDNGTFYFVNYYNATNYTTYYWRIHFNDTQYHGNNTFNFINTYEGGILTSPSGLIGIIGMFGFVTGLMALNRNKKQKRKEDKY
jgi:hypothetical protein